MSPKPLQFHRALTLAPFRVSVWSRLPERERAGTRLVETELRRPSLFKER
jgi:hypothetical protein